MRTLNLLLMVSCCIAALSPRVQSATVQACQTTDHWWFSAANPYTQCSPKPVTVKQLAAKFTGAAKALSELVLKDAACLAVKDINKCPATCSVDYQPGGFAPQICTAKDYTFVIHKDYACPGSVAAKVFDCLATFTPEACSKKPHCIISPDIRTFWYGASHPCIPSQLKPYTNKGGDSTGAKNWLKAFLVPGSSQWTKNYGTCSRQAVLKSFLKCRNYSRGACTAKAGCYWQTSAAMPGCYPLAPRLNQLIDQCAWNLKGAKCTGLKV